MKKTLYILAGLAILFTSCTKALDKKPLDKLTEDTFFESENALISFTNTFYTNFAGGDALYKDDADNYFQLTQLLEARGARTVPASGSGWTWTKLRDINTLLDNQNQCKDENIRKKYVAIARFFRAQFYFDKVKRFGDVPWFEKQLAYNDPLLYKPRDSRETVMNNIIADLNYAIDNLPTTDAATRNVYKISKWTALALKSRVCLFEGTYRKYHGISYPEHDWKWYLNQCVEASEKFLDQSGYEIYDKGTPETNYLKMFTTNTIKGSDIENDVILARNYNATYSVTHNSTYTYNVSSMGKYGMSRKTMASYLMNDGTRFTDKANWQTMEFKDEVKDRDPRLAQTIRTPGYTRIDKPTEQLSPDLSQCISGYQPIKYVGPTTETYDKSDGDLILFRTGEVCLNFAEAKAELGGTVSQADLDKSINKLRARVGMPSLLTSVDEDPFLTNLEWGGYQNVSQTNKALILEIRRERCVELNQEGFRYYDLMRWKEGKIFEQKMYGMYFHGADKYDLDGNGTVDLVLWKGAKPSIPEGAIALQIGAEIILSEGDKGMVDHYHDSPGSWNEVDDKDYLYPLPTDEINLSKGAYKQNPGW